MVQFNNILEIAHGAEKIYKKVAGIPEPLDDNQVLLRSIRDVEQIISKSESLFNEITDKDLIDYTAYHLLAEKSRYSYLLREAKRRNLHF